MNSLISGLPKKAMLFATVALVVAGSAGSVKAWYPQRQTFTMQNPAPYVTFDSITDNPNYGDERTFFDAKNTTNTGSGGFSDANTVTNGEEVLLRIYVHNDAASNLNTVSDGKGGYVGVATGAKARIYLPTASATSLRANAYIDASNANPTEVADTTDFTASTPFQLSYVPGSAVMYTNAVPGGFALNDSIVSNGAPIGYTGPNGTIPGCMQYTGIITIKAKVNMESFSITKTVAKPGSGSWSKSITANPGDTVAYQLTFTNTGGQQLKDVRMIDKLPSGVSIVSGSTKLFDQTYPKGTSLGTDALVSAGGIDIGTYNPSANAFVQFKATMPTADKLKCGANTLVNTAQAWVGNEQVNDTATVTVNKTCQNTPPTTPTTPTTPQKPTTLVNTGAGSVAGLFATITVAGAFAHRWFLSRRLSRQ